MLEVVAKKKKLPIIKSDRDGIPSSSLLREIMRERTLKPPFTVRVAFKIGKRRKLKNLRVHGLNEHPCDLCGSHTYISYRFNGGEHQHEIF